MDVLQRCKYRAGLQDGGQEWLSSGPCNNFVRQHQGWTALAEPKGLTFWSRHGQSLRQGSPSILLFELVLCATLPGVGPGKSAIDAPSWRNLANFKRPVQL